MLHDGNIDSRSAPARPARAPWLPVAKPYRGGSPDDEEAKAPRRDAANGQKIMF